MAQGRVGEGFLYEGGEGKRGGRASERNENKTGRWGNAGAARGIVEEDDPREACRFDRRRVVLFKQSAMGIKFQEVAEMEGSDGGTRWVLEGRKDSGSGSDGRWAMGPMALPTMASQREGQRQRQGWGRPRQA